MKRRFVAFLGAVFAVVLTGFVFVSGLHSKKPYAELSLSTVTSNGRPFLVIVVTNLSAEIGGSGLDYPTGLPPVRGAWRAASTNIEFTTSNFPFTAIWKLHKGSGFTRLLECPPGATGVTVEFEFERITKLRQLGGWFWNHNLVWAANLLREVERRTVSPGSLEHNLSASSQFSIRQSIPERE